MIFRDRKLKLIEMEWIETGTLATKCNKARIDEKKNDMNRQTDIEKQTAVICSIQ